MNENQEAAYIFSQSVCALCKAFEMAQQNIRAVLTGQESPYSPEDFLKIPEEHGLTHNQVLEYFKK